jgi:transcriptional regulator with XRE-family HTH domain
MKPQFKPLHSPTPGELKEARERLGLTQTEAARLTRTALRTWQHWEQPEDQIGHRRMPAALWELFIAKTVIPGLAERIEELAALKRP